MRQRLLVAIFLSIMLCIVFDAKALNRIAAIVNGDVITTVDIQKRLVFLLKTGVAQPPQSQQQNQQLISSVLKALIDERLKLQAAKTRNVSVTKSDIDQGALRILKQLQTDLNADNYAEFMQEKGIPVSTFQEQLKSQIAWGRYIGIEGSRYSKITKQDIEHRLALLKKQDGQVQKHLYEIYQRQGVQDFDLEAYVNDGELNSKDFKSSANQYSQNASQQRQGEIGWLSAGRFGVQVLDQTIASLDEGQISDLIYTEDGVRVLYVAGQRTIAAPQDEAAREELEKALASQQRKTERVLLSDYLLEKSRREADLRIML